MSSSPLSPVKHRRVFYIPGYDPFPPRRYRELYRREAALQSSISSYMLSVAAGSNTEAYVWHVEAEMEGCKTLSDIEVLVWSDIVRRNRASTIAGTYFALFRTVWVYWSTGAFWRLMRLRKGPVIAALYPVVALLIQLQLALLTGWLVWRAGLLVVPVSNWAWLAVSSLLAGYGVLGFFQRMDNRIFAYYLMHDFDESARRNGAYGQDLESRIEAFAARVLEVLDGDYDEVLLVGHSSGAHLAISVASTVLQKRAGKSNTALSLLTLGHVVPMVTFLPDAGRLRADLACVSSARDLFWLDVSAPGDGCCFALCDPVAVSGQNSVPGRPVIISAAFSQTLSAVRWRRIKWRFFRIHFQYLCAFDRPNDYDYFQITAGPTMLAQRFDGRKSSRSVIAAPVSAFTDRRR